jgi:hypothetical protein
VLGLQSLPQSMLWLFFFPTPLTSPHKEDSAMLHSRFTEHTLVSVRWRPRDTTCMSLTHSALHFKAEVSILLCPF